MGIMHGPNIHTIENIQENVKREGGEAKKGPMSPGEHQSAKGNRGRMTTEPNTRKDDRRRQISSDDDSSNNDDNDGALTAVSGATTRPRNQALPSLSVDDDGHDGAIRPKRTNAAFSSSPDPGDDAAGMCRGR